MAGSRKQSPGRRQIGGSVDLLHEVVEGEDRFNVPGMASVAGPCDGQADGTPCGEGCTCRGGQPWYSFDGMAKLGVRPELAQKK